MSAERAREWLEGRIDWCQAALAEHYATFDSRYEDDFDDQVEQLAGELETYREILRILDATDGS